MGKGMFVSLVLGKMAVARTDRAGPPTLGTGIAKFGAALNLKREKRVQSPEKPSPIHPQGRARAYYSRAKYS
jgi:hypothetical protein